MPINENDQSLFTITHSYNTDIASVVEELVKAAEFKIHNEGLKIDNCYPEIFHDKDKNNVTLTIYQRYK